MPAQNACVHVFEGVWQKIASYTRQRCWRQRKISFELRKFIFHGNFSSETMILRETLSFLRIFNFRKIQGPWVRFLDSVSRFGVLACWTVRSAATTGGRLIVHSSIGNDSVGMELNTVLSRGVRSLFGPTRKSSPWGNFSDCGSSVLCTFDWLIDWR